MREPDLLQRFIFENHSIRGELVHLDETFQTIVNQHTDSPGVRRLLGEALSTAALLTGTLTVVEAIATGAFATATATLLSRTAT